MTLALDTTTLKVVRLRIDDGQKTKRVTLRMFADRALPKIAAILRGKRPKLIAVVNTTGAFSATRNGVAIANALSYAWEVPVAAISRQRFDADEALTGGTERSVPVIYDLPPNITQPKPFF